MKKSERLAIRARSLIASELQENPFDRSYEEMTDDELLMLRTELAEHGKEITPAEMRDTLEIIKYIRAELR